MAHLFAAALVCASLTSEVVGYRDETSFMQKDVSVHNQRFHGICECLDWSDVQPVIDRLLVVDDRRFFSMLNKDNYCMNTKPGAGAQDMQYCYVHPDCTEAEQIPGEDSTMVKMKWCSQDQDKTLADMNFEDFLAYANENMLEKRLMSSYVYPTLEGASVSDAQSFWGVEETATPITDELRQRLEEVRDSGETTLFNDAEGYPAAVAEGDKFYSLNYNPAASFIAFRKGVKGLWANRDILYIAKCVAGCAPDETSAEEGTEEGMTELLENDVSGEHPRAKSKTRVQKVYKRKVYTKGRTLSKTNKSRGGHGKRTTNTTRRVIKHYPSSIKRKSSPIKVKGSPLPKKTLPPKKALIKKAPAPARKKIVKKAPVDGVRK